jgi:hypothetical protein
LISWIKKYFNRPIVILDIFSLKRSGQHAIINWLCSQNKPSVHYNACDIETKEPRNDIIQYTTVRTTINKDKFSCPDKLSLIVRNFESQEVKICDDVIPIVILREPRNWLASKYRLFPDNLFSNGKITNRTIHIRKEMELWKKHAQSDVYTILFDEWFQNKEYRKSICNHFGLKFSDKGLNDVYGHGKSGFDDFYYDGKAQHMNILNRWKHYEIQIKSMIDPEMIEIWNQKISK